MASTGAWKPLVYEPSPDDSIVEAPSLVMPLLLKTKDIDHHISERTNQEIDDDVQIIDEQNGNVKNIDDYVKSAYVAALTKKGYQDPILTRKSYYKSSAGNLLLDIGLRHVFERNLEISAKRYTNRLKHTKSASTIVELTQTLESIKAELNNYRESNKSFKPKTKFTCPRCPFFSEFKMVVENHLEEPHISRRKEYLCNWCEYKTKSADQIIAHFLHGHNKRCRIEKPLLIHLCRFCPYETNSKVRIRSHSLSCSETFPANSFLGPQDYGENDFPGVTSKLITQEDIQAYERTRNALLLSSYNPNQINVSGQGSRPQRVMLVPRRYTPAPPYFDCAECYNLYVNNSQQNPLVCNPFQNFINSRQHDRLRDENGQSNQSRLMQLLVSQNRPAATTSSTVLHHPNNQSLYVNGRSALIAASGVMMAPVNQTLERSSRATGNCVRYNQVMNSGRLPAERGSSGVSHSSQAVSGESFKGHNTSASKKCNFIICEICDCYTRDLFDLRSHMNCIHEVKISQKSLERRPPLSCQKCKWRFFTDLGLERHMLGVHSLVTSNLQNRIEQGKDSGRCTICGKAFANGLVNHMKDAHKANLKLAYLSYKCTICDATFNLYGLFESHVLSIHPESVK